MTVTILHRFDALIHKEEREAANRYFRCTNSRVQVESGDLVVARYSALPYYNELEHDLKLRGASLINTYDMHCFVADMDRWANGKLSGMTPKTWTTPSSVEGAGPFVLKGQTNSRKHLWDTHMYAKDRKAMMEVYCRLLDDSLISTQEIYIREYVPLVNLMTGFNGLPISKEFRFFCCYGKVLCGGFYWSSHVADLSVVPSIAEVPMDFLHEAADLIKDEVNFFAIDVAEKQEGGWTVVEVNDGQMSGLSENDPDTLYTALRDVTSEAVTAKLTV